MLSVFALLIVFVCTHVNANNCLFCCFIYTYKSLGGDVSTQAQQQQRTEVAVSMQDSRAFFARRQTGSGAADDASAREGEPDDVTMSPTSPPGMPDTLSTFARDSTRRSLANNVAMWKWLDAQERQQDRLQVCGRPALRSMQGMGY